MPTSAQRRFVCHKWAVVQFKFCETIEKTFTCIAVKHIHEFVLLTQLLKEVSLAFQFFEELNPPTKCYGPNFFWFEFLTQKTYTGTPSYRSGLIFMLPDVIQTCRLEDISSRRWWIIWATWDEVELYRTYLYHATIFLHWLTVQDMFRKRVLKSKLKFIEILNFWRKIESRICTCVDHPGTFYIEGWYTVVLW